MEEKYKERSRETETVEEKDKKGSTVEDKHKKCSSDTQTVEEKYRKHSRLEDIKNNI